MTRTSLMLVTIITEKVLEPKIAAMILEAGASGYTVTDARGHGSRHVSAQTFEGHNARIETLVTATTADRIVDEVANKYFPHYGVIAFTSEVNVVRGENYP